MKHDSFMQFLPLLVFTALLIIAAGMSMAVAVVKFSLAQQWELHVPLLATALLLALVGGAFSFLHLGRKGRAGRAALGIWHSWLSREAVLAGLFTASTASAFLARIYGQPEGIFTTAVVAASVFGLLITIVIGKLYDLKAQLGWRGWAQALTPSVSAPMLGLALVCSAPEGARFTIIFYAVWLADVALLGWRDGEYKRNVHLKTAFSFPFLGQLTQIVYNVRKLLSIVAVFSFGMSGGKFAATLIAIAIFLDRFCLYAATATNTPTTEMSTLKTIRMRQAARG